MSYVDLLFVADQIAAHPAIAECVSEDGPRVTVTTADGRTYTGAIVVVTRKSNAHD